jgi:hypothetical protein
MSYGWRNYGNYGPQDKRKPLKPIDLFDAEIKDDKTMRCLCDGKHVCKGCLKREQDYYKNDEGE